MLLNSTVFLCFSIFLSDFTVKDLEENTRFVNIFSDEETSEEEDCDGEEDYMNGVKDFLQAVDRRREDGKRFVMQ